MSPGYGLALATFGSYRRVRYPVPAITATEWFRSADEPVHIRADWLAPVDRALRTLRRLPADWDTYGAQPVRAAHADAVLIFLAGVLKSVDDPLPDVVPLADGGVQLEWRRPGLDVDYVSDDDEPGVLVIQDDVGVGEWTGPEAVRAFREHALERLRQGTMAWA